MSTPTPPSAEELKKALKAFKKRLKHLSYVHKRQKLM